MKLVPLFVLLPVLLAALCAAAPEPGAADQRLASYFRAETARLEERSLADVKILEDWTRRRGEARRQLAEMLGLDPPPEKTPLQAAVTGGVEHPEFTVENVEFQSRPGLYVTGNLYLPKSPGPAPAVLYVCGHGTVKKDGISYGAKASYQHHGSWLARNGYVCLVIDTLQLGEIEGLHHGTYREGMWWWNSRGYSPAGVEAWNGIRALDYLQSRPEVDPERLGITGRSGGGAYSWWVAALDDRIKCAVPVAGITDLRNHVVDGTVEGHCDCMFLVNTYGWDYAEVAALVAPRPLLIANSDKDPIFPLEGVSRIHEKVRTVYRLYGAADKLGLTITEGPHRDTQELQVPALHWFNRHLKGVDPPVESVASKLLEPEQLKVFKVLPSDQQNTRIHETFVPAAAAPAVPQSRDDWARRRDSLLAALRERTFRGWPQSPEPVRPIAAFTAERGGVRLDAWDFTSQEHVPLRLYVSRRAGDKRPELVVLNVLDQEGLTQWLAGMRAGFEKELQGETLPEADSKAWDEIRGMFRRFNWAMAYVAPRGIGRDAWSGDARKHVQIRRRFMLLGQTLAGMRVWDTRRAAQALRGLPAMQGVPLWLQGERDMAVVALYAGLFEPGVARMDLWHPPRTHQDGPDLLNVLKTLDVPEAVSLAAEKSKIRIYQKEPGGWEFPAEVGKKLGWDSQQVQVRVVKGE